MFKEIGSRKISVGFSLLMMLTSLSSFAEQNVQTYSLLDLKPSVAQHLLGSEIMAHFSVGKVPMIKPLTSLESQQAECVEDESIGLICADDENLYVGDERLQSGKEFGFRNLLPPKIGVPIIDNNREALAGAIGGTLVAGPIGAVVGAGAGALVHDKEAANHEIDELKRQNREAEGALMQAKMDRARDQAQFSEATRSALGMQGCLQSRGDAFKLAVDSTSVYLGKFNSCLGFASDSPAAQGCLNDYEADVNAMVTLAKKIANCQ